MKCAKSQVSEHRMAQCSSPGVQFSMDQCPLSANQVARMHGVPYIQAIGSVLWPIVISWPDAAYAVGVMSQFMPNLGPAHWEGLK